MYLQIILPNFCRNTYVEAQFKTKLPCLQQYLCYISIDCNSVYVCVVLFSKIVTPQCWPLCIFGSLKAIACRVHAVPKLFPAPRSWPTLFGFTLPTCIWDCYASDNILRGTPRGSRKKPNAGRSPTCRPWTADVNSHMPCRAHAVLCRGVEKSLSERHGRSTVWARHGHDMTSVNQTRPRCVNQMGKTQSNPLAARHGRGTAWARHTMCELALISHILPVWVHRMLWMHLRVL